MTDKIDGSEEVRREPEARGKRAPWTKPALRWTAVESAEVGTNTGPDTSNQPS